MYSLGIDLGTSSVKASLLDIETGLEAASSHDPSIEIPVHAPQPGWAEQDPEDWWNDLKRALSDLPKEKLAETRAIGIAYQMHGMTPIGRDGKAVRNAIIWCDGRAASTGDRIAQALLTVELENLRNRPGNFTLSKLKWVRDNESLLGLKIDKVLLPGDYFAYRMSGEAQTSTTGLSEMIAWDFEHSKPSDGAWRAAAGSLESRPQVVDVLGTQATLLPSVAAELGLPVGIPISYRAGDQPNNAASLGVMDAGEVAATAGTSGVLYAVSDKIAFDPDQRVNSFLHVNGKIGTLFCLNGAGSCYSWLKRALGAPSYEALNATAEGSTVGASGLYCHPFGNGAERMLGNASPGASFSSIDFNRHGVHDLARAGLEGVVFAMKYGADILASLGGACRKIRAGNANMFRSELFRRSFASLLGAELTLYDTNGALGAARMAGLGAGLFESEEQAFAGLKAIGAWAPEPELHEQLAEAYGNWLTRLKEID